MYKDKYEKNAISVEIEIDEEDGNTIIKTVTTVKDNEIYPPLNLGDKKIMDRVVDIIVNQQQAILNTREFWLKPPKEAMKKESTVHIVCERCGNRFEWTVPCCNKTQFTSICPKCGLQKDWKKQGA